MSQHAISTADCTGLSAAGNVFALLCGCSADGESVKVHATIPRPEAEIASIELVFGVAAQ
jgi:hypothetical protein